MIRTSLLAATVATAALFGATEATFAEAHSHGMTHDVSLDTTTTDPAEVVAGTYTIDPTHTNVNWTISHMGLAWFTGRFDTAEGTMVLDPANVEGSSVNVTITTASVSTISDHLDEQLVGDAVFDAEANPTITFVSSSVERTGDSTANVTGALTMAGVTKDVTLKAEFQSTAFHPFAEKQTVGFTVGGMVKRSDFEISPPWSGFVGDTVYLEITTEAQLAE